MTTIQFDVILTLAQLAQKQIVPVEEDDIFAQRDVYEVECMIKEKRFDVPKMLEQVESAISSLSSTNMVASHLLTAMGLMLLEE